MSLTPPAITFPTVRIFATSFIPPQTRHFNTIDMFFYRHSMGYRPRIDWEHEVDHNRYPEVMGSFNIDKHISDNIYIKINSLLLQM